MFDLFIDQPGLSGAGNLSSKSSSLSSEVTVNGADIND